MATTGKNVKLPEPDLIEPVIPEIDPLNAEREPAGRIIHDERGNAVWKWVGDVSSTGTGSGILKHLDPNDLKIEGQGEGPGASTSRAPDPGRGYDPYNQARPGSSPTSGKGGRAKR